MFIFSFFVSCVFFVLALGALIVSEALIPTDKGFAFFHAATLFLATGGIGLMITVLMRHLSKQLDAYRAGIEKLIQISTGGLSEAANAPLWQNAQPPASTPSNLRPKVSFAQDDVPNIAVEPKNTEDFSQSPSTLPPFSTAPSSAAPLKEKNNDVSQFFPPRRQAESVQALQSSEYAPQTQEMVLPKKNKLDHLSKDPSVEKPTYLPYAENNQLLKNRPVPDFFDLEREFPVEKEGPKKNPSPKASLPDESIAALDRLIEDELEKSIEELEAEFYPPASKKELKIVGAYNSGGIDFTMYEDGSVRAISPEGEKFFASIEELRMYLSALSPR